MEEKVPKGRHDRCESPLLTCKSHVHVSKQHIKMDQPFIQIRTTCAFVSARIKITKAINSHETYVKENLAQGTAYPKCSDTRFKFAWYFFFSFQVTSQLQLAIRNHSLKGEIMILHSQFILYSNDFLSHLNFFPRGFKSYSYDHAKTTLRCTVNRL